MAQLHRPVVPRSHRHQIAVREAAEPRSNTSPGGPATTRATSRWTSPSSRTATARVADKTLFATRRAGGAAGKRNEHRFEAIGNESRTNSYFGVPLRTF